MKLQLVLLALVVAGVCAHGDHGGEATYAADSPVVSLTSETFAEGVKKSKLVLVEFYAPWCGHCKSLKPHYEEAAQAVKSAGLDATLAAVDATTAEDVSTKYGIRGFPTLKLFRNGELTETEYDGERNAEAIFEWVSAFFAPALVDLNTQDDVDKLTQGRKVVVLGHFTLPEQAAAQKAFHEAVAAVREEKSFSHVKFGEVKNAELAKKLGLDVSVPVVSVRRDFGADNEEAKEVNFDFFTDAGFDTAKMANFIRSSAFPILAEITPENYSSYEKRGLPFVWVFLPGHGVSAGPDGEAKENPADVNAKNKQYRALVREVATPYAARLSFVYLSGVDYADHATGLGVSSFPGICIMPTEGRAKFIFDQEFTADNVRGFVTGFLDKKLAPSIKSEPVPEKQEGPVKVVVAKTFDAEVYDSDSDVFIEFYAPWCGHCKKLAPVWDELATLLKNTKGITIAKIDATANDVPEQIEGFPTLYFKKAGNKEHKIDPAFLYDGDRTKEALMQYIREQSSATLPELPADTGKISKFVDQFTKMQKEITKLVKENEELKARVAELEGSGAHSHDHGHDHHDHDHDHHHHDHDHHGHHHGHDDL